MKNFKMLKKFGAAVTAVAMVGSMSVVAFADELTSNNIATADGGGISITGVDVEKEGNIYTIKVLYETTTNVEATADITMLSYVGKTKEAAGEDHTFTEDQIDEDQDIPGYADETTMQIVGIDQDKQQTDSANQKFVEFKVSADGNAPINVNDNMIAVIKLGGEGITAPAAAIVNLANPAPPWEAVNASLKGIADNTLSISAKDYAQKTEIDAFVASQTAVVTNGLTDDALMSAEVALTTEGISVSSSDTYNQNATEKQTLVYTITIGENTAIEGVTIPQDGITFEVKVEVAPIPQPFTITNAKAMKNGVEVTAVNVENGTTAEEAIEAIVDAIDSVTVYGANDEVETGWSAGKWAIADYDGTTAGTYVATAALVEPTTGDVKGKADGTVTTVSVNVVVAEPVVTGLLGDVDDNGVVDDFDWMFIFDHTSYIKDYPGLPGGIANSEGDPAVITRADVNKDGQIDDFDWMIIFDHTSYIKEDPNLPAW